MKSPIFTYIRHLCSLMLVATLSSTILVAQSKFSTDAIQYEDVQIQVSTGELAVSCQILIPQDVTPRSKALLIQPIYKTNDGAEIHLPHLILNGKWQAPYYERQTTLQSHKEYIDNLPYGVATLTGSSEAEPLVVHYEVYQKLASNATGQLEMCYFGLDCCDVDTIGSLALASTTVESLSILADNLSPLLAAKDEPIKRRQEEIELRINYPFDRSEVIPDYRQNEQQLRNLRKAVEPILQNPQSYKVTSGSITGYASPEGPEAYNKQLSERRAKSIKDYLVDRYGSAIFATLKVVGAGADWNGLHEVMTRAYDRTDRSAVLAVLDAGYTPEQRQEELAKLPSYEDLKRVVYPPLRRSTLRLEYEVRTFSLEESIAMMKSRPKDLSVSELYRIASAYEREGRNTDDIYRIAAESNPTDVGAQVNYSRILLLKGQLEEAWQILEPLRNNSVAYNNIGVYYMLTSDEKLAEEYLRKALSTEDAAVAQRNLDFLLR